MSDQGRRQPGPIHLSTYQRPQKPASYRYPMCPHCHQRLKKLTEVRYWCGGCQRAVSA